ncbi:helix-turn-helix transcriptional regulator [Magnetovibrio sp. PR-2]|uniref:helix-turn-helix domain-containing protein n=1 Tax=Magnetovibrio sp. PR-2 TaxID=3120356 RepID=UPI002FCDE81D
MTGEYRMLTAPQIRAARALLDWTQHELAERSSVSISVVKRMEVEGHDPRTSTVQAIQSALEKGGVVFVPSDDHAGEGVRMKTP